MGKGMFPQRWSARSWEISAKKGATKYHASAGAKIFLRDMKEFQELTKDIDPEKKDALKKILNRFYE